jgi:hypothetical protein
MKKYHILWCIGTIIMFIALFPDKRLSLILGCLGMLFIMADSILTIKKEVFYISVVAFILFYLKLLSL